VKPIACSAILLCLLAAACASGPVEPEAGDPFVAEAEDPAARREGSGSLLSNQSPLTSEEVKAAALKINELEIAAEDAERNKLLEHLIGLGPRYLEFYRQVDREAVVLDIMYVIRRIEREHNIAAGAKATDTGTVRGDGTSRTNGGAALTGPGIDYTDENTDFNREEVERFLAARLEQARLHLEGGRFDAARRIAEAAITLLPDTRLRADFDALLGQAKGESQANLLIAGTLSLEPENLQFESDLKGALFKKPLMIRCYLKNVSGGAITLLLYEGKGKESILQLTVTYEQHDVLGTVMSQTGNVRLPIDAGDSIKLQPGDSYELSVPLESLASLDDDASRKYALGLVQIDAALRFYGAQDADGKPMVLRPVRFPLRSVKVFPSAFDLAAATAKPMTSMRTAFDKGWAQELFMCAHLVGKG